LYFFKYYLEERHKFGDIGIDGMKYGVCVWTGFFWLRLGGGGGLF
jgi:hypothetical protein